MVMRWIYAFSTASLYIFTSVATKKTNEPTSRQYPVKSGIKIWVDPATPDNRQTYTSSRGRTWDLVMSDEFNMPDRDFRPGKDHLWTSIEKPDGVNGALEVYNHNMTSTKCDDDGTCYFYIQIIDEVMNVRVFNQYRNPPSYVNQSFFYRGAMVQSWNKFCFQGGMMEARVQLPGAVSKESGNPDLAKGKNGIASENAYYPTWPGIWMMGNLGRAIFSASTNRMWPFSYSKCEPDIFDVTNQRINACNNNPGFGLNPNQGRGAPEIDLLEGSGTLISSSLQLGPGMPPEYRLEDPDKSIDPDYYTCFYGSRCKTIGANVIDVPTAFYKKRGHGFNWYKGLRYAANPFCQPDADKRQNYEVIANSLLKGIVENSCSLTTCPASNDVNSDLGFIDGDSKGPRWGINTNGTCFPLINAYIGSYLCDPDNQSKLCSSPRNDTTNPTNIMKSFNYQMDAISANWPVHVGAYTDYLVYQIEWVTGAHGYLRWMLDGHPLFEVTSETIMNVSQGPNQNNPVKLMIEEPMSIIMNVALSSSWGTRPPNAGKPCRGDGKDSKAIRICDSFPMYMKVDYIRIYQDKGTDLEDDNYMQVGCDPKSHPTREWIASHIEEYEDEKNPVIEVAGKAFCTSDDDCTVSLTSEMPMSRLVTGKCVRGRCNCLNGESWGGPRCSVAKAELQTTVGQMYGPPLVVALAVAGITYLLTSISLWHLYRNAKARVTVTTKTPVNKDISVNILQSPRQSHMKQRMVAM